MITVINNTKEERLKIKKIVMTGIGFLFLLLAAIGIFLPIWPTTPFVLAAVGCLAYTPRLKALIHGIPFFREYIDNYRERKGLTAGTVCISLLFLWGTLLISSLLVEITWVRILLLGIGMAVTVHILWISGKRRSCVRPDTQETAGKSEQEWGTV